MNAARWSGGRALQLFWSFCVLGSLLATTVLGVPSARGADDASPRISVGVILPLTGTAASYGEQFRQGLELAAKSGRFDFIYEDSHFDSATALTAWRKLTDHDRIDYLISFGGATCEVLNREAQRARIIHFAAGCNTAAFADAESFNFRLDVNEAAAAAATAHYLQRSGVRRLALLYVQNSWAEAVIRSTRQAVEAAGIAVVQDIPFSGELNLDVRTPLTQLRTKQPDRIFFVSLPALTPVILRQIREAGLSTPLMSNISVENPEVVKLAGPLAEGITYLAVKDLPASRAEHPDFYQKFPSGNPFAAWGYDSAEMLTQASAKASPVEYLRTLSNWVGAFNAYTFNRSGELDLHYEIRAIENGRYVHQADL